MPHPTANHQCPQRNPPTRLAASASSSSSSSVVVPCVDAAPGLLVAVASASSSSSPLPSSLPSFFALCLRRSWPPHTWMSWLLGSPRGTTSLPSSLSSSDCHLFGSYSVAKAASDLRW